MAEPATLSAESAADKQGHAVTWWWTTSVALSLLALCAMPAGAREWVEEDFGQLPVAVYTFTLPEDTGPGQARA